MATASDELIERLNRRRRTIGDVPIAGDKWYTGPPPAAPTYPELVSATDTTLKIKWTPPPLPAAPAPKSTAPGAPKPRAPKAFLFKVEYGFKYSMSSEWTIAANNVRVPKYTIEGLDANTTYATRVSAKYVEGGEWGPPSSSSWGMATLTQAAAAEIRAKKAEQHDQAVNASVTAANEALRNKAELAAARAKERAAELERALASSKTEAERERLLRENLQRERDRLDAESAARRNEAARLQAKLAQVTQAQEEFAAKAAAATEAERKRREEAMAYKAAADAAAAARAEEAASVQKRMAELNAERRAMEAAHQRKLAQDAEKSEAEKERLRAERAAEVAALQASQHQLEAKLTQLESDKVEAARLAEARAKQEAQRLAEAHARLKRESEEVVARQQAQVEALNAKLAELRVQHEHSEATASSKIEEEAARKEEAEALVRYQIELAEKDAATTNTQISALKQQVARFEQMMLAAKENADQSAKTAEACTSTIVLQAEENERLRRKARYQEATIRSLQGAGPNPELEAELVAAGNRRENVRFFMEVYGWDDKSKIVKLLEELNTLKEEGGYPDDALREALTVCTDKAKVKQYLNEYVNTHHLSGYGDDDDEGV